MKAHRQNFERTTDTGAEMRLYRLDPPMSPDHGDPTEYVIVSALACAWDTGRPETLIFRADKEGKVQDYMDLPGSYRGGTDHNKALENTGYEVIEG